jgi:hypothetical protein
MQVAQPNTYAPNKVVVLAIAAPWKQRPYTGTAASIRTGAPRKQSRINYRLVLLAELIALVVGIALGLTAKSSNNNTDIFVFDNNLAEEDSRENEEGNSRKVKTMTGTCTLLCSICAPIPAAPFW